MALGIALVTNSNLGTTPITSLPYALGAIFALSLGTATFLLNLLFVALQKVLLRKEFSPVHSAGFLKQLRFLVGIRLLKRFFSCKAEPVRIPFQRNRAVIPAV